MEHLGAFMSGCEHTICGGYVGPLPKLRGDWSDGADSAGASHRRATLTSFSARQKACQTSMSSETCISDCPTWASSPTSCVSPTTPANKATPLTTLTDVTQRDPNVPIHATPQNFDNLDKAFVIFKLPGPGRKHRRVDLISSPRERYAAAVLSWSGSMMFERDLK